MAELCCQVPLICPYRSFLWISAGGLKLFITPVRVQNCVMGSAGWGILCSSSEGEDRVGEEPWLQVLQSHLGVKAKPLLVSSTAQWCSGLSVWERPKRSCLLIDCEPNALGYWLLQTTNAKGWLSYNWPHVWGAGWWDFWYYLCHDLRSQLTLLVFSSVCLQLQTCLRGYEVTFPRLCWSLIYGCHCSSYFFKRAFYDDSFQKV